MHPDFQESPMSAVRPPEDPRTRFAAERTLLAWVRTGLAMMGFGFVVARFGLFLRELAAAEGRVPQQGGWSMWFGVGLVMLGVAVTVLAAVEYRAVIRRIDRGDPYRPPGWSMGLVTAILLAVLGVAMVGYLIAV
jgi:putative membrane protein